MTPNSAPYNDTHPESTCYPTCGNGLVNGTEACDDGNLISGDGCSSICVLETNYSCSVTNTAPFTQTNPESTCGHNCGNGVLDTNEFCDDGNVASFDGCSDKCVMEADSHTCTNSNTAPYTKTNPYTSCIVTCGNGVKTNPENCDDGNTANFDGCSSACNVEQGWECLNQNTPPLSATNPYSSCTDQTGITLEKESFLPNVDFSWKVNPGQINGIFDLQGAYAIDNMYMGMGFRCTGMADCDEIIACYKTSSLYACK